MTISSDYLPSGWYSSLVLRSLLVRLDSNSLVSKLFLTLIVKGEQLLAFDRVLGGILKPTQPAIDVSLDISFGVS